MKIQINEFRGIVPKIANDKIPNEHAQVAMDLKLATGELQAFKKSTTDLALPGSDYKTFFQYIDGSNAEWAYYDGIVFWARSPVADDTFNRTYFLGESGLPSKGTLTVDTTPTATDTMVIGATTFTFVAVGAGANPGDIEVGLNALEAQENITAAIEGTDGYNTAHATVEIDTPWSASNDLILRAKNHGVAGDSIATTETFTAGTNVFDAVTLGTTQAGQEDGEYRAFANDIDSSPWDFEADYYLPGADVGAAPTLAGYTGGGSTYKAYFYTHVSRYGEEGPGSAIDEVTDYASGRMDVDDIDYPAAADTHLTTAVGTNYPTVRVYRTSTTGTGQAAFLRVCEAYWFSASQTYVQGDFVFYDDGGGYDLYECTAGGGHGPAAWNGANFTQGEAVTDANLGTETFQYLGRRCPDNLTNLRQHPNGFFVASLNNTLYFSEPYGPWAWPEDYEIPLPAQIKGIGVYGQTIVVCTDANIYTFSGNHPTSLYKQKGPYQPCLSQRAVAETDLGVMFPALEGFQLVDATGEPRNVTADTFKPEDWEDYELETMHGTFYNKAYYGWYKSDTYEGSIIIDFLNKSITTGQDYHYAGNVSIANGIFRTIYPSNPADTSILNIAKWDKDETSYRNFTFRTKRYVMEYPVNFKVAQIIMDLDWYADVLTAAGGDLETLNATTWATTDWGYALGGPMNDFMANDQDMNGDDLFNIASLGLQAYIEFKVYVNGILKWTKQVTSNDMFKLPRGFKDKKWEFEMVGMIPVKRLTIATSTEEIARG
jgi:hypothetical protein